VHHWMHPLPLRPLAGLVSLLLLTALHASYTITCKDGQGAAHGTAIACTSEEARNAVTWGKYVNACPYCTHVTPTGTFEYCIGVAPGTISCQDKTKCEAGHWGPDCSSQCQCGPLWQQENIGKCCSSEACLVEYVFT
jgi:hypothetical protein